MSYCDLEKKINLDTSLPAVPGSSKSWTMEFFPAFLDLRDKPCLVVGGGSLAIAKARLLLTAQARVRVVGAANADDVEQLNALGLVILPREFRASDVEGCAVVISAAGDATIDRKVSQVARDAGVPVNVVDNPKQSTFVVPAIVDRGPIVIGITSGGAAPLLARRVRAQIEAMLPARLGDLARFAGQFRGAVKAVIADARLRRRFWDRFFGGPLAQMVLSGRDRSSREAMLALVNGGHADDLSGSVAIVGAGPGDPDLLTLKALRALQSADVIVYDRLVGKRILDFARRDAERIFVGKAKDNHTLSQNDINALLAQKALAGSRVVRLKGGDPFIFGRGGEERDYLAARGIDVTVVPGITAATAAAAAASVPLTHRDTTQAVTFVTGHGRDSASDIDWAALARLDHTIVVYMGLANAQRISDQLINNGMAPATPVAIIENATLPAEKILSGTAATFPMIAGQQGLVGPVLIIIGEVAASAAARQTIIHDADLREVAA